MNSPCSVFSENTPKPSRSFSEDVTGSLDNFIWLLDGATPPSFSTEYDTFDFVQKMSACLENSVRENRHLKLKEIVQIALKNASSSNFGDKRYCPYSTLAFCKKLEIGFDYFLVGDSYIYFFDEYSSQLIIDDRLKLVATEERRLVRELNENGVPPNSDQYIRARDKLISAEVALRNTVGGYWAVSADGTGIEGGIEGRWTAQAPDFHALLMSDGFARVVTHYTVSPSYTDIAMDIMDGKGLEVTRKLRHLESSGHPPLVKSSSKHDDAAFILI